jgi:hypothetical protein
MRVHYLAVRHHDLAEIAQIPNALTLRTINAGVRPARYTIGPRNRLLEWVSSR